MHFNIILPSKLKSCEGPDVFRPNLCRIFSIPLRSACLYPLYFQQFYALRRFSAKLATLFAVYSRLQLCVTSCSWSFRFFKSNYKTVNLRDRKIRNIRRKGKIREKWKTLHLWGGREIIIEHDNGPFARLSFL
jgi:hypothetical protein